MKLTPIFCSLCFGLFSFLSPASATTPIDLRVEGRVSPLGIDQPNPRFSWKINTTERGYRQSYYQILVASNPTLLEHDQGDLWSSGEINSTEQLGLHYQGKSLASTTEYFWKVKLMDATNSESNWSQVAKFETAYLKSSDWIAQFVGGPEIKLLRKDFLLTKPVLRARAYVSAYGIFELRLNGKKVGDATLEPVQTNPTMRLLYEIHDVTKALLPGKNAVAALLGGGAYARLYNHPGVYLWLQLKIDYTDGTSETIITDPTWKGSQEGPTAFADLYVGESYNAQKEMGGWDQAGFDDHTWTAVSTKSMPPQLTAQTYWIKEIESLPSLSIKEQTPHVYLFDLGNIIAGRAQLTVKGPAGLTVQMRYGEVLQPDGRLNTATTGRENKTTYTLKGSGIETWAPRFFTTSFRYVEVTGLPGTPTLETIKGLRVSSDLPITGSFTSSSELLNAINKMYLHSQADNFSLGIPSDCPGRERLGWLGDAMLTTESAGFDWDATALYEKWFNDFDDDAKKYGPHGSFHSLIPWPDPWGGGDRDTPWSFGTIIIPWDIYQATGDPSVLASHYQQMVQVVKNMGALSHDHLINQNAWGDWVSPYGKKNCDVGLLSSAYYYRSLTLLAQVAEALGKNEDSAHYLDQGEKVREAINAKWLGTNDHYDSDSQTANALALDFDLVPETKKKAVLQSLVKGIMKTNYHLSTGVLGTYNLLHTLEKYHLPELADQIISQVTYPGWGYMVDRGATSPWEHWWYADGGGDSQNHVFLAGPPTAWFYRVVAGITPLKPGYQKILIEPHLVGDLTQAGASTETTRGLISSSWTRSNTQITLAVTIPPNTSAEVNLPLLGFAPAQVIIEEGSEEIWPLAPGIDSCHLKYLSSTTGSMHFAVDSGDYHFVIRPTSGLTFPSAQPEISRSEKIALIPAKSCKNQYHTQLDPSGAIGQIEEGAWLEYQAMDLSDLDRFQAAVSVINDNAGETLEVRIDNPTGPIIGTLVLAGTGGLKSSALEEVPLLPTKGFHPIFLTFRGGPNPLLLLSFGFTRMGFAK